MNPIIIDGETIVANGAESIDLVALDVVLTSGLGAITLQNGAVIQSNGTGINAGGVSLNGTIDSAVGANAGIYLTGDATVRSIDGNIALSGQAGNRAIGGNNGITLFGSAFFGGDAVVESTGTGANAATIVLDGTGGVGTSSNTGVLISANPGLTATVTSVDGSISVTGQGGGTGTGGSNFGIAVLGDALVESTGTGPNAASIVLDGTGGAGTNSNIGVFLADGNAISSVDGDIAVTGQGGGTGNSNDGIRFIRGTTISSLTGDITLDGTGAGNLSYGIFIGGGGISTISSDSGDVTLKGEGTGGRAGIFWLDLDITKSSGNWTFDGSFEGTSLITSNGSYDIAFNDDGTLTNAVTFNNTGELILGNDIGDNLVFAGGLNALATDTTQLGGNVDTTTNGQAYGDNIVIGQVGSAETIQLIGNSITLGSQLTADITSDSVIDTLDIDGTTNINNSTLVLNTDPSFDPIVGNLFTLIDGNSPINGTFNGLAEGNVFTVNDIEYSITYQGGADSNNVVLEVTKTALNIPIRWDEAIDGDFSNAVLAPTEIGTLETGDNIVRGALPENPVEDGLDIFSFAVPAGMEVTAFLVNQLDITGFSSGFNLSLRDGPTSSSPNLLSLNASTSDLEPGEDIFEKRDFGGSLQEGVYTVDLRASGDNNGANLYEFNIVTKVSIPGTTEADRLIGTSDADSIFGNAGNDALIGRNGDDKLNGGAGNDILRGEAGADNIDGGNGNDLLDYITSDSAVNVNLETGDAAGGHATGDTFANIERLRGSKFDDQLTGDSGRNTLMGNLGNDSLDGGAGNDVLRGEAGADTIDGGNGSDLLDYVTSDAAVNINLNTGSASGGHSTGDTFINVERVRGSKFDDQLTGDSTRNTLIGGLGNDSLNGGAGNDLLRGEAGADNIDGDDGNDLLDYITSDAAVSVNLETGNASGGHATGDTFINVERVRGSKFDDQLTGDDARNTLIGRDGDDTLNGGANNDVLRGEAGADIIDGGSGNDLLDYINSDAAVSISLAAGSASGGHATGDTFVQIESVRGSQFDDQLIGNDAANTLIGGGGGDVLTGGGGNDALGGGDGIDVFVYAAQSFGMDTIVDFANDLDKIDLRGSGLTFGSFTSSNTILGALLQLDSENSILLIGVNAGELTATDFLS